MELVKEIDYNFDFNSLLSLVDNIVNTNVLFNRFDCCSVQHRKGILEPWTWVDGVESLSIYPNDVTEESFTILNNAFDNTELENIISKFNLFRSRLLRLTPKTCYSIHKDVSWRLHIPIITSPNCLFYFPDHKQHYHLEQGKIYKVNTTQRHTFMNASKYNINRIHFIGCL